ncbi:MAG: hypothetical protein WAU88_04555 [Candidatus Zixiibacteriota bacterium]
MVETGRYRTIFPLLIAIFLFLGSSTTLFAQTGGTNQFGNDRHWTRRGYFGFHIGFVGVGQIRADTISYETKPGFTFGVKFDARLNGPLYWGVTADIHRLHVLDTGQYLFDLGLNLRRSYFVESARVSFRPGIGVGFGYLANFREYDPTGYLLLKGGLELIFFSDDKVAYLFELQVMGAPLGGRPGQQFRLNPMMVGRVGLLL